MNLHCPLKQGATELAESLETDALKTPAFSDFSTTLSGSYKGNRYRKKEYNFPSFQLLEESFVLL